MTNEKKAIWKRLFLFLVLAFVPVTLMVVLISVCTGKRLYADETLMTTVAPLVETLGMCAPGVACILTRVWTKEGWKNSYLRANFKGNLWVYALAILLPVGLSIVGGFLMRGLFGVAEDGIPNSAVTIVGVLLAQVSSGVLGAFFGLGEELGWRGYLMPKLEQLMGLPASLLVGGIIWGLWHAPLTICGHNFGVDYAGYPYAGIGLMCLMCVLMGTVLTAVTRHTKSVYPAAILHMVSNSVGGVVAALMAVKTPKFLTGALVSMVPLAVVAVAMGVWMLVRFRQNRQISEA